MRGLKGLRGLRGLEAILVVSCLASLVLGCGREGPDVAGKPVAVTNVVEAVREVVVTNVVTETLVLTNVVVERREPERILSARKTAPYVVSSRELDEARLRRLLSEAGARVIESGNGAVALVEATDRTVGALRGAVSVSALSAEDKIAVDAGEKVRIVPTSSIDAAAVTAAVRADGGTVVQVTTVGSPVVRAVISYSGIRKLAARGDVRRIERDDK